MVNKYNQLGFLECKGYTILVYAPQVQVCPISDELKVVKFLFPSPLQFSFRFYGWIETCCPDLLHQFMSSPCSSLDIGHSLVCCCLLLLLPLHLVAAVAA